MAKRIVTTREENLLFLERHLYNRWVSYRSQAKSLTKGTKDQRFHQLWNGHPRGYMNFYHWAINEIQACPDLEPGQNFRFQRIDQELGWFPGNLKIIPVATVGSAEVEKLREHGSIYEQAKMKAIKAFHESNPNIKPADIAQHFGVSNKMVQHLVFFKG